MPVLNQPFSGHTLGGLLIQKISSGLYTELNLFSAFAKNSGVLRLKKTIQEFSISGGIVNAFIGIDLGGTSYEALISLFEICSTLTIIHSENSSTYHPKIYSLSNLTSFWFSVGSNNLTLGGLWTNFESCYYDELTAGANQPQVAIEELRDLFLSNSYECAMQIESIDDLNYLLENSYIFTEATIHISNKSKFSAKKENKSTNRGLFGKQRTTAPSVPKESQSQEYVDKTRPPARKATSIDIDHVKKSSSKEIFWYEMRKSTGGSRNILDLSKKGKVMSGSTSGTFYEIPGIPTNSWGGILFFGIDPSDVSQEKHITINFLGHDYYPAVIKYPVGSKANGSWRIQLKGNNINEPDKPALSEFGTTHFVDHILFFEKINDLYYSLSSIDISDDSVFLDDLKSNSRFSSVNGNNKRNKSYGLIDVKETDL